MCILSTALVGLVLLVVFGFLANRREARVQEQTRALENTIQQQHLKLAFIQQETGIAVGYGEFAKPMLVLEDTAGNIVRRYAESDIAKALQPLRTPRVST